MLNDDERSRLLAEVVIILEKRNSETAFKFLTPFLGDSDNLRIKFTDIGIEEYKISEYIKSERFYIFDEKNSKKLKLYDQFMDEFYDVGKCMKNAFEFIGGKSGTNNIIYLNKPQDIEEFSVQFSNARKHIDDENIEKICNNLKDFIHPQYRLLDCISEGCKHRGKSREKGGGAGSKDCRKKGCKECWIGTNDKSCAKGNKSGKKCSSKSSSGR